MAGVAAHLLLLLVLILRGDGGLRGARAGLLPHGPAAQTRDNDRPTNTTTSTGPSGTTHTQYITSHNTIHTAHNTDLVQRQTYGHSGKTILYAKQHTARSTVPAQQQSQDHENTHRTLGYNTAHNTVHHTTQYNTIHTQYTAQTKDNDKPNPLPRLQPPDLPVLHGTTHNMTQSTDPGQ